ncbi:MAG: hypothetical protein JJE01_10205 [Gemmatimonadetes bacterium]|nr:hypothetical protein [Gemmatimonadota bacterium]
MKKRISNGRAVWLAIGMAAFLAACGGNAYMSVGTTIPVGWGGVRVGTTVPIGGW